MIALVLLFLAGIAFVYWFFNSGVSNEQSTFIDRTKQEEQKESVQDELDKLLE